MNKENQIKEMAKVIDKSHWKLEQDFTGCHINSSEIAEYLYNADYRKQSEVVMEIFDEIERILSLNYCCYLPQGATEHYEYYEGNIAKDIAELKKKYTGEKEDEQVH